MSRAPSLRYERELLRSRGARWLASIDEVGRGALGGPVTVGVVLVDLETKAAPTGVRDSKLLTPAARVRLVPRIQRWAPAWAVAHASAEEIDAIGILRALRLAGERAFAQLPVRPDHVLLDGSYDWVSRPAPALFDEDGTVADPDAWEAPPPVTVRVKADMTCSSVAPGCTFDCPALAFRSLASRPRDTVMWIRLCVALRGSTRGRGLSGAIGPSSGNATSNAARSSSRRARPSCCATSAPSGPTACTKVDTNGGRAVTRQ